MPAWRGGGGGVGVRVEPGSLIIMQVHYNTASGEPVQDQTTFQVQLADQVERPAVILPVTNSSWIYGGTPMTIAAGDPDATHSHSVDQLGLWWRGLLDGRDQVRVDRVKPGFGRCWRHRGGFRLGLRGPPGLLAKFLVPKRKSLSHAVILAHLPVACVDARGEGDTVGHLRRSVRYGP